MEKSQVELFLERIKTDNELREKIQKFEEEARASALIREQEIDTSVRANAYTIIGIAKEAGYDIPRDFFHEAKSVVSATEQEIAGARCAFTCCWLGTSCHQTCGQTFV
jgi:hypothetical protein